MIKYTLKATIPCVQYGNLMPEIELEGESIEELHATAMAHISKVWGEYGEKPLKGATKQIDGNKDVPTTHLIELESFTGEKILWDEANHKYYDKDMNVLMSGSAYADKVSPKFDKANILPKTAKSWGVEEGTLDSMWNLQGQVSNEYGSSIHTALDIWHKFNQDGKKIQDKKELDDNYALPKNEHIKSVVLSFDEKFGSNAVAEVLVTDTKSKMAGRIDRLEIVDKDKKVCRVGDYKTNNDLDDKKVKKYQHQLSFYAKILQNHGWVVSGLDIFHYDGKEWNKKELEVLEINL